MLCNVKQGEFGQLVLLRFITKKFADRDDRIHPAYAKTILTFKNILACATNQGYKNGIYDSRFNNLYRSKPNLFKENILTNGIISSLHK